jgi:transcriptional regulator with XRE-family HTH domain
VSSTPYTWPVPRAAALPKTVPSPDEKAFGRRVQEIRKRRGLSQVEVAQRLGIHQSLVSQYERGYLRLHGALVVRLAQLLRTTPDEILAVKDGKAAGDDQALDRRFLRRLQKIDRLTPHQKKILLGTIDAFLSKVS